MTILLRLEGLALFVVATAGHGLAGGSWWMYLLLLLIPDISMIGYLAGPRWGAWCYNAVHSTILPLLLGSAGWWLESGSVVQVAAIWLAHIGLDRALGFGLKYPSAFKHTHLSSIEKA